jgi:hypothetical protein
MALPTSVTLIFALLSWVPSDTAEITVRQTTYGDVWVTPLSAPPGWKDPAADDATRGGAVPEGTCPIVSGLDPSATPISLVIGKNMKPITCC